MYVSPSQNVQLLNKNFVLYLFIWLWGKKAEWTSFMCGDSIIFARFVRTMTSITDAVFYFTQIKYISLFVFLFFRGFKKAQVHIGQVSMGKGHTLPAAGLMVALTIRSDIPLRPLATLLSQPAVTCPPHPTPWLLYQLLPCTQLPQAFPWPKRASMRRAAVPLWPTTAAPSTQLAHQIPTPQAIHKSVLQWWARRA